jgi:parvulin-like peptidyl-prolyl isomerase
MHLKHILVAHKYEAEDILKLLKEGQDFSDLAKQRSTCPSAPSGGDLGNLKGKKLDMDFEEAAELLKPGQISGVVRTRFGYHLIQRVS